MKYKLLNSVALPLLALFVNDVQANLLPPKPEKCPGEFAIQVAGIDTVRHSNSNGLWSAGNKSNYYDTKEKWIFVIYNIDAKDENDARNQALKSLHTLKKQSGPTPFFNVAWQCTYKSSSGLDAFAITFIESSEKFYESLS